MLSQSNAVLPVLIAGAGPTGLVLALALLKNGIAVRIIDKYHSFHNTQRGAGLQPRTLEAFNLLGVLSDIQKDGKALVPTSLYKLYGSREPLKTWEMAPHVDPVPSIPWPNVLIHGQQYTEAILRSHLEEYGVRVELGTELRSFQQDAEGVSAHIVKTIDGRETEETVHSHWLVGADGARGVVRKQLGLTFLGETRSADLSVIADLFITGLDRGRWHIWGDASTELLIVCPTERDDDSWWIMASGKIDHAKLVADRAEFVKHLHKVTNRDDIQIGEIIYITEWRPNVRMVDKFQEGRVFVVGDAAHIHSPTGGQGLNSSIQDALNLGWKLALVEKSLSPTSILSSYNSERLPVIAEMLQLTTVLLNKTMATKADNFEESAWKRGGKLTQLGVNYRWSEIVVDERNNDADGGAINAYGTAEGGSLHAGDRAPDAPMLKDTTARNDTLTSLFRIFSPAQHTALLFTDKPDGLDPELDALKAYPAGTISPVLVLPQSATSVPVVDTVKLVLQDTEGHAYAGYGVAEPVMTIVIIRPDGVVGAIVYGVAGLERYRNFIFSHKM